METTLSKRKQSNFSLAFMFLDKQSKKGMDDLYAFCRYVDDVVDEQSDVKIAQNELNQVRLLIEQNTNQAHILKPLIDRMIHEYGVLKEDLLWIVKGVEMDLKQNRFNSMNDLLDYCDGVASSVGLCLLPIIGLDRKEYHDYAIYTGRALQLTNIIRDVLEDFNRNRIYLPMDDLKYFGIDMQELKHSTKQTRSLIEYECQQAKLFYEKAQEFVSRKNAKELVITEMMRKTYRDLLNKIQANGFDVWSARVELTAFEKFKLMAKSMMMWVKSNASV